MLSHLHFDHAGGLVTEHRAGSAPELLFPRATFIVGTEAWARAKAPHARDRASFIPELVPLLEASGRLELVEGERSPTLGDGYRLHRSEGHTPGLMLAEVSSEYGPVVFAADLIPGRPWVHLPITMGYDRFPERLIDEKTALLTDLLARDGRLFFTHDPECALPPVTRAGAGRFGTSERWDPPPDLPPLSSPTPPHRAPPDAAAAADGARPARPARGAFHVLCKRVRLRRASAARGASSR